MDAQSKAIVAATDPANIRAAFVYLDDLKDSGKANMFTEAATSMMRHDPLLTYEEARALRWAWQETFDRQTPVEVRALRAYAQTNDIKVIINAEDV